MTLTLIPAGKIPAQLLPELLNVLPKQHPQLLLGPSPGEDAAVIDFAPGHEQLLVAKSDPITFATDEIGFYAVNVCANDLAVTGARPLFYLPTLLFPENATDERTIRAVFEQIGSACRQLGVAVAGGHSEITPAVNQPVVAGTMLGQVRRERFVSTGGSQPGDMVLMAGVAPIEGASIIAREKRDTLMGHGWTVHELDTAANFLHEPGISVLQPALLAADGGLVTAMHDPTEGGIATGLLELAVAAGLGLEVDLDAIEIPNLARRLCEAFGLDPLGTIASGCLLATARPENVRALQEIWRGIGWSSAVVGKLLPVDGGVYALRDGGQVELPRFAADEITKLWD